MYAIRYEENKREIGEVLDNSRVWFDGHPTDEYLDGTSCLIEAQDKYTGEQYRVVFPHKYLVEGRWISDGQDDGEVVLEDCTVIEVLF
jgi:hypothetical protein